MAALLMLGLGFVAINAQAIPDGIMPKRQLVGTGLATSGVLDSITTQVPTSASTLVSLTSTPAAPVTSSLLATSTPTATTAEPTSTPTTPTQPTSQIGSQASSQGSSEGTTTAQSPTSSAAPTSNSSVESSGAASTQAASSELPTTVAVTTTDANGRTVTSSIATSTLVPASKTTRPPVSTETGSLSSFVVIGSSTINRGTLSGKTTITSALLAEETSRSTYTSYWTENGTLRSSVITTENVFTSTTGYATATLTPSFQNGGGTGSNLSTASKQVIGGVVGGIGGAALIGGIALVAWRLWGKKRRQDFSPVDMLDSPGDSIHRQKRASAAVTPAYSNPNGAVNTASNF